MNCYRLGERKKMIADSKQPPPPPESLPTELSNAGVRINMTVNPPLFSLTLPLKIIVPASSSPSQELSCQFQGLVTPPNVNGAKEKVSSWTGN